MVGHSYAILIGNSDFTDSGFAPLRCPLQDVRGLSRVLSSPQHWPYEVCSLENQPHHVIRRQVYSTLKKAERADRVLIYYSGHGKIGEDDGALYLACADTQLEELPATSLSVAEVNQFITNSRSKQLMLILDCCYSGRIEKLINAGIAFRGDTATQVAENLRAFGGSGRYVLTAAAGLQTAEERESDEYGLLTKHIIAGIAEGGADRDDDGLISWHELVGYVQERVQSEGRQRPVSYALREEDGGLIIAQTGKPARIRRRREVLKDLFQAGVEERASIRMIHSALLMAVPDATLPTSERVACEEFLDRLHNARNDAHHFIEILEEGQTLADGIVPRGSSAEQVVEIKRLRNETTSLNLQLSELRADATELASRADALQRDLARARENGHRVSIELEKARSDAATEIENLHARITQQAASIDRAKKIETELAELQKAYNKLEEERKFVLASAERRSKSELILSILRKYKHEQDFFVHPDIPASKLHNATLSCGVPAEELVLALVDVTVFGSAKDAILFGETGIYQKGIGSKFIRRYSEQPWDVKLSFFGDLTVNGVSFSLSGTSFPKNKLFALIREVLHAVSGFS